MHKLLLPLLLLLAGCVDVNPPPMATAPNYKNLSPIRMKVSNIEVLEDYQSPGRLPNAEHLMPYSPADAMQLWIKDRMRAVGGANTLQIVIKDASVIEKKLPTKQGVSGWLSVEQDKQYDARLEVEMRIYGTGALSEASINVVANSQASLSEGVSANMRDAQFRALVNELMTRANSEFDKNISLYLRDYVAP